MKKLVCVAMLLVGGSVYADNTLPLSAISSIDTGWGGEGFYLKLEGNNLVEGCTDPRVRFEKTLPMIKEILSISLSALNTNKRVYIRVSGCVGGMHKGTAISVVK